MKINTRLLGLGLLLLLWQPRLLRGQENPENCRDVLYMLGGNRLTGQITEIKPGDTLVFKSWGGAVFQIPRKEVKRIVQDCRGTKGASQGPRPYTFKERGVYHHSRGSVLIGQAYYGLDNVGLQIQHSSGWMFSRLLGAGLGTGIERFDPGSEASEASVYPLFAEIRGYALPKRLTPYYSIAAGWGFAGKNTGQRWGYTDTWRGGWMAQAEIGYRIGNHLIVHGGLRLQRKYRDWASNWGGPEGGIRGTDRILHKRLVLGLGLLL